MSARNMAISCMQSGCPGWEVGSMRSNARREVFLAAGSTYASEDILEGSCDCRFDRVELAFCMSTTFELGRTS